MISFYEYPLGCLKDSKHIYKYGIRIHICNQGLPKNIQNAFNQTYMRSFTYSAERNSHINFKFPAHHITVRCTLSDVVLMLCYKSIGAPHPYQSHRVAKSLQNRYVTISKVQRTEIQFHLFFVNKFFQQTPLIAKIILKLKAYI